MKFLEKIRELPFKKRKIILWSTVSIIGLFLLFFWARGIIMKFQTLFQAERKEIDYSTMKAPRVEIPILETPGLEDEDSDLEEPESDEDLLDRLNELDEPYKMNDQKLEDLLYLLQKMDEEDFERFEKLIDESQENNGEDLTDIKKLLKSLQKIKEIKESEN